MPIADRRRVGNLPSELSSFIGRRRELSEVRRLLAEARLVTLTGVAGIGKTRLALRLAAEVARAFPDGVWLVDLGQVQDAGLVAHTVAATLGLREPPGNRPTTATLTEYLADRRLLLVLDNCEHLVDAVAQLADRLLRAAGGLRILATSRESLAMGGETIFPVPPLSLPDPGSPPPASALNRYEAVSLFIERAAAVAPGVRLTEDDSAAVVMICHRLEGLPLAIELAAARLPVLPPSQILERLSDRYRILVRRGPVGPPRHQTLRACIAWSYDLCTTAERALWARLAVFSGGFELDAAEGVCAGGHVAADEVLDLVSSLVNKSILVCERHDEVVRYRPLETLREFGRERLRETGEERGLRRRHRDWYEGLITQAYAEWASRRQADWFGRLDREHANVQVAMDYCLTEPGEAESTMRMLLPLFHFYFWARGWYREGRQWIERARALTPPSTLRATVLLREVAFLVSAGDFATANDRLAEGRALAEELGDPIVLAHAAYAEGMAAQYRGELAQSIASFERGLVLLPEGVDLPLRLDLLLAFAVSAGAAGNEERAVSAHETTLALTEPMGEAFHRSYALWALGLLAFQQGDIDRAADLQRRSLGLRRQCGDVTGIGWSLEFLAWPEGAAGRHLRAAMLLGAADQMWEMTGLSLRAFQHLVPYHDDCERRARKTLGDTAFEAAFQQGRDLGVEDVIRYALDEVPPPPNADPSGMPRPESALTRREWQVAELIADGRSNREVAATLVISTRTAESHVEHILVKLGLTNRVQVAAWLRAHLAGAPMPHP
jgi:predicted ATPase/DNA-binding CsgD family transcriptional regulator